MYISKWIPNHLKYAVGRVAHCIRIMYSLIYAISTATTRYVHIKCRGTSPPCGVGRDGLSSDAMIVPVHKAARARPKPNQPNQMCERPSLRDHNQCVCVFVYIVVGHWNTELKQHSACENATTRPDNSVCVYLYARLTCENKWILIFRWWFVCVYTSEWWCQANMSASEQREMGTACCLESNMNFRGY